MEYIKVTAFRPALVFFSSRDVWSFTFRSRIFHSHGWATAFKTFGVRPCWRVLNAKLRVTGIIFQTWRSEEKESFYFFLYFQRKVVPTFKISDTNRPWVSPSIQNGSPFRNCVNTLPCEKITVQNVRTDCPQLT